MINPSNKFKSIIANKHCKKEKKKENKNANTIPTGRKYKYSYKDRRK